MSDGGNAMADMDIGSNSNDENQEDDNRDEQPMDTDTKPPFEKLTPRARKLLRWIPVVKFFGMGEDGYYSIHIKEGCVNKTSRFIKRQLPDYKFHFVPFGNNESIHLLHYPGPGSPVHGSPYAHDCCVGDTVKPHGTLGGIAALINLNGEKELYALTANHVVEYSTPCKQYISWTKPDQSDKIKIGTEVPFRIPLKMDDDVHTEKASHWNDNVDDDDYDEVLSEFEKYFKDVGNQEQEQYDIACIKVDDQGSDIKEHFAECTKCCLSKCSQNKSEQKSKQKKIHGAIVEKLGTVSSGKILRTDAAGFITAKNKTAWVDNMTVICSGDDEDAEYIIEGDSGSIVVCADSDVKSEEDGHRQNCFMVFAGLKNANKEVWGCSSASLVFPLESAIDKIQEQFQEGQRLQLSCFKQCTKMNIGGKDVQSSNNNKLSLEQINKQSSSAVPKRLPYC